MTLKPTQYARNVGVRWEPNEAFVSHFIEPLIDEKHVDILRRTGGFALRSKGLDLYNGEDISLAAQFDKEVGKSWKRRDLVEASVDSVLYRPLEQSSGYELAFHLEAPHAGIQRELAERSIEQPPTSPGAQMILESVFVRFPARVMRTNEDSLEVMTSDAIQRMRELLADQAIRAASLLERPRAYIEPYRHNEVYILEAHLRKIGKLSDPDRY